MKIAGKASAKVSVSGGEILSGDLLTTSVSAPGILVKSDGGGGVAGVALQSTSTDSTIEILVRTSYSGTSSVASLEPTASQETTGALTASQQAILDKFAISGDGTTLIVKGDMEIQGDLQVTGHITGSSDTAGEVTIAAGTGQKEYIFTKPYNTIPIVTATPTSNPGNYFWVEPQKDRFIIKLAEPQAYNIKFNYHVMEKE